MDLVQVVNTMDGCVLIPIRGFFDILKLASLLKLLLDGRNYCLYVHYTHTVGTVCMTIYAHTLSNL